ncbi:23S rRNA (pseudouridine(1915)-N(3))-methyltransferase RlmH [Spiroplasma endosymbiont of Amphibalanus improvisus]|uniref:23S rRNA (pseudouridine(1915)-N(3))-methyltransferase RlmH n=1 Tax=Spiroplasma endosymbiont of Amphibalanus improvisus TaxID=3066327 RepID=UPI00313D67F0
MKIKIIAVGKISKKCLLDLSELYFKKIERYADIEIIKIKESKDKNINVNRHLETNEILSKIINLKEYALFSFDVNGVLVTSQEFAKIIDENKNFNSGKICFIIGGSDGLDNSLNKFLKGKISFGKITYPHQLFRAIVFEQIYRSFKIINNEKYHK